MKPTARFSIQIVLLIMGVMALAIALGMLGVLLSTPTVTARACFDYERDGIAPGLGLIVETRYVDSACFAKVSEAGPWWELSQ